MAEKTIFDPYYVWLGIPPEVQPADYHQLLGVQRFEARPDVLRRAYSQRKKYVTSFSRGPHRNAMLAALPGTNS